MKLIQLATSDLTLFGLTDTGRIFTYQNDQDGWSELDLPEEMKGVRAGESAPRKRFKPPTYKEVRAYCDERENRVDPVQFCDFYTSKNWMVGKVKMTDWQAAVRSWEKQR